VGLCAATHVCGDTIGVYTDGTLRIADRDAGPLPSKYERPFTAQSAASTPSWQQLLSGRRVVRLRPRVPMIKQSFYCVFFLLFFFVI
jgi:hypothetical protein